MPIGKKQGIIIALVIVALIGYIYLPDKSLHTPVSANKESMQTYLLYKDIIVEVPTMSTAKKVEDKIKEAIHYMSQSISPFTCLLKEDTILNEVKIKDGVATLDFASFQYDEKLELRVLESLIYTVTQFAEISQLAITLEGEKLSTMPLSHTPLRNTTRTFGMNHVDSNQQYLHKGEYYPITYEVSIQDTTYRAIRSVKISGKDQYNELLDLFFKSPNVASAYEQPLAKYHVRREQDCSVEKKVLHLYLSKEALSKDKSIKKEIVTYLKNNLKACSNIHAFSIHVNGEVIAIDGKNKVKL